MTSSIAQAAASGATVTPAAPTRALGTPGGGGVGMQKLPGDDPRVKMYADA